MPAYIIVQITVNDEAAYARYREDVPGTIKKFGGEYIVRGGDMEVLEGEWRMPRCVVLRFPDMPSARAWYSSPDYQEPKAVRQAAAVSNAILIEGV